MLTIDKKHEKLLAEHLKIKDSPWIHEQKLWKKVERYKKIFSYVPGILCICVWNSLAMNACHKNSDIDVFIITKNNRIWTSRIVMTLVLTVLWQRKTAKKHAWRFCLSFFITQNTLNLENIAIKNDIYLAYWIETLIPIVNKHNTFEEFQAVNTTPLSILSYQERWNHNPYIKITPSPGRRGVGRGIVWKLWNMLEKFLKTIFLPRTKKSFQKLWKPFWVIISDDMLKFHDKDKRKEIRDIIFF